MVHPKQGYVYKKVKVILAAGAGARLMLDFWLAPDSLGF